MPISRSLVRRSESPTMPALAHADAHLFAEALRRGEATRNAMEDALVDYGRWLLVNVFQDDAGAALDTKSENPLWIALLARAGGPTLRISRKVLYVAVEIAARDKRINDDNWRMLEPGRKELLLPLADESTMRRAARHVVAMKLSQDKTREYVAGLRAAEGDAPKVRLTVGRVLGHMRKFQNSLGSPAAVRRLKKLSSSATEEESAALKSELDTLAIWLTAARKALQQ